MDGRYVKMMNQIMLRFRPIAPKPVGDGGSGGGYADPAAKDVIGKKRAKRKYVRVKKKDVKKKDKEAEMGESESTTVTLELLPTETQQQQQQQVYDKDLRENSCEGVVQQNTNIFNTSCTIQEADGRRGVVESFVRVECVTDVWSGCMDEDDGDEEKVRNLDVDKCPGFVSDGGGEVRWVNQAYRRMVGGEEEEVVVVRVVMKVGLLPVVGRGGGFSCRVRVYGNDNNNYNKQKFTQTTVVPCDVWRMEFGGFAWRLDVQAALSLGR